jgi:hypothetical protein
MAGLHPGSLITGPFLPGRPPTFVPRQQGRKVFEAKWSASLAEGGELENPELINLTSHSEEWSQPNW